MNYELFTELAKLSRPKQSPYDFMKYLLKPIDNEYIFDFRAGLTTSTFHLYYTTKKYKRSLPRNIKFIIQQHPSWKLPAQHSESLHTNLQDLYIKYLPDCVYPKDDTEAYSNLVRFCCTGDYRYDNPALHFSTCSFAKASAKSDKFVGRCDELSTISTLLNKKKRLCISGTTGIGKTFLAKNWLYLHKKDFSDVAYIQYTYPFESSLNTLKSKDDKQEFHTDTLKHMPSDTLLIIDNMNGTTDTLKHDLHTIFSLPFYVIIITRNTSLTPTDCTLHLQPLPPEDLMSFFPETKIKSSVLLNLIDAVNANTLMLSIISKAWAKQNHSESFINSIIEAKKLDSSKNRQKFKILYTGHELTYLGQIREIVHSFFCKNVLDNDNLSPLNFVSCIPNSEINIKIFLKIVDKDINWFNQMLELGVFSTLTPTTFFMPQLIADAFYFDAFSTFSFKNYQTYIDNILNMFQLTQSESPAYEQDISYILYKFILRFSPFVKEVHNKGQITLSSEQQSWCSFIYASIKYMQSFDMIELANDLLKKLTDTSSELLYENIIYPVNCLNFFNSWISGSTSGMKALLSYEEGNFHGKNPSADFANYITCILLDKLILDYMHGEEYTSNDNYLYHYNLMLSSLEISSLSKDKCNYYQNIYHLLSEPADTYAELKKLIDTYFNSLQHTSDLHIKLYGFCIGIHAYRNCIHFMLSENKCTINQINTLEMDLAIVMHTVYPITNNATLLPQLDFQMALVAYIDYFSILSLKFDIALTADACLDMLVQKAPYLTDIEKNAVINAFHQNISNYNEYLIP